MSGSTTPPIPLDVGAETLSREEVGDGPIDGAAAE